MCRRFDPAPDHFKNLGKQKVGRGFFVSIVQLFNSPLLPDRQVQVTPSFDQTDCSQQVHWLLSKLMCEILLFSFWHQFMQFRLRTLFILVTTIAILTIPAFEWFQSAFKSPEPNQVTTSVSVPDGGLLLIGGGIKRKIVHDLPLLNEATTNRLATMNRLAEGGSSD